MKRLTPLILAIPLVLSACSSTDDAPAPTSTSSTTTSSTTSQRTTESSTTEPTSTEPSPIESAPPAEPAEDDMPNEMDVDQPQDDVQQDAPAPVEEEPAPAPAPLYEQPSPVEESPVQEAPAYTGGGGSGSCADIGHKVYIGDSDYAPKLDRNGDGVGCEAYPG